MFNVTVTAKFLTHAKIKIHGIVAYTFLSVCEKFTSFCQVFKRCTQKKISFFSASLCISDIIGEFEGKPATECLHRHARSHTQTGGQVENIMLPIFWAARGTNNSNFR